MNDTDKIISAVEKAMEKAGALGEGAFGHLVFKTSTMGMVWAFSHIFVSVAFAILSYHLIGSAILEGKKGFYSQNDGVTAFGWVAGCLSAFVAMVAFSLIWENLVKWLAPHGFVIENILSRL